MEQFKAIWKTITIYFPDVWQYLVIIIIMVAAAIFIL
jgi:hypothetical protein